MIFLQDKFELDEKVVSWVETIKTYLVLYGMQVLSAFLVLVAGWFVIRLLVKAATKIMVRRDVDASLIPFLRSIISIGLKILLILTVISMLGIQTTSLVAALGAAGLAIGLALQGSLSNFAGGVLILLFKPFRVGDFIEAQGQKGVVQEIQILYTILATLDNRKIVIPNGNLSNNVMVNFSAHDTRRIELSIAISYKADVKKAKLILQKLADEDERILKEPLPIIGVQTLGEFAVSLSFMFWVNRADYMLVNHEINERIREEFIANNIELEVMPRELATGTTQVK